MKYFDGMSSPKPFCPPGSILMSSGIGAGSACHTPERSGVPCAPVRGAGAARFGLPSAVRGRSGVGWFTHCAWLVDGANNGAASSRAAIRMRTRMAVSSEI
jgi:hypothetical protein